MPCELLELCAGSHSRSRRGDQDVNEADLLSGPYTTAWSSGDTVIIDYWTGMTEYKTMYPVEFIYPSQHWSRHTSVPLNTGINTGTGIMVSGFCRGGFWRLIVSVGLEG